MFRRTSSAVTCLLASAVAAQMPVAELANKSEVVVVAQVVRVEHTNGERLLTLEVKHLARGMLPATIEVHDVPGVIGQLGLYFLERDDDGGAHQYRPAVPRRSYLPVVLRDDELVGYAREKEGVLLPKHLLLGGSKQGTYVIVSLNAVFHHLGLRLLPVLKTETPTFRVTTTTCAPCDFETYLQNVRAPNSIDCSAARFDGGMALAAACIKAQQKVHRDFFFTTSVRGFHGSTRLAYGSNDGGLFELFHVRAYRPCLDVVSLSGCRAIMPAKGESNSVVDCVARSGERDLCREGDQSLAVLGAPRPVSQLRCDQHECVICESANCAGEVPKPRINLVCDDDFDTGSLSCRPSL